MADQKGKIDSIIQVFQNSEDDANKVDILFDGIPYLMNTEPDTVIYFATKGALLASKYNRPNKKVRFVAFIGDAYFRLAKYSEALEHLFNATEMAEEMGNDDEVAYLANTIGSLYRVTGKWDEAETYYKKALNLRALHKDTAAMASCYNNIGIVNMLRSDYDIGMHQWGMSLQMRVAIGDSLGAATTMSNMAMYYRDIGETTLALDYLNRARRIKTEAGDLIGEALACDNLGELYMKLKDFKKGEEFYLLALEKIIESKSNHYISSEYEHIANFYKMSGDFEKALNYLEIHQELEAEILNESTLNNMSAIKSEHEAEKARMTIENLEMSAEMAREKELAKSERDSILFVGLIIILFVVLVFAGFAVWKFLQKKKDNRIISKQKAEVEEQRRVAEFQKDVLFEKNREIMDSINYAQRLQSAILPDLDEYNEVFKEAFILYLPKDVIAGDFYWMQRVNGKTFFAIADCTGHGVPGAMVSVVCSNALDRAVKEFKLSDPSDILTKTSELVEANFLNREGEVKDGMDIALCCMDDKTKSLKYAGANNNLYLISEGELIEFKAGKQPIGAFDYDFGFETHEVTYKEGDAIYLFTDGYADQFGGEKGKKLKYSNFKRLLLEQVSTAMSDQESIFANTITEWRGDLEQVDDICLMGVRL